MRLYQRIRTIFRSQDSPNPEPGTLWIFKTEDDKYVLRCWEDGLWHDITGCCCNGSGGGGGSTGTINISASDVFLESANGSSTKIVVTSNVNWESQLV